MTNKLRPPSRASTRKQGPVDAADETESVEFRMAHHRTATHSSVKSNKKRRHRNPSIPDPWSSFRGWDNNSQAKRQQDALDALGVLRRDWKKLSETTKEDVLETVNAILAMGVLLNVVVEPTERISNLKERARKALRACTNLLKPHLEGAKSVMTTITRHDTQADAHDAYIALVDAIKKLLASRQFIDACKTVTMPIELSKFCEQLDHAAVGCFSRPNSTPLATVNDLWPLRLVGSDLRDSTSRTKIEHTAARIVHRMYPAVSHDNLRRAQAKR